MFDRSLVTSGFDTETLISERYLSYLLLAQIEAGLLALEFPVYDAATNTDLTVRLHPPLEDDYKVLYSQSQDPELPTREFNSFRCTLLPGVDSGLVDLAFTSNGTQLLTRSIDGMVRVWNIENRTQNEQAAFEVDPALGSAFNAAGTHIATASSDHKVRIWDLNTKGVVLTLDGHMGAVACVAFSPDGQRLASGSVDETVRVWDLQNGTLLHTLAGHVGRVTSVAFNHAGSQIVSGGEDGLLRVWNAQDGTPLHVLQGHTGPINCAIFTLNDQRVVSGSDDKTARLWNFATEATQRTFKGHTDAVVWVDVNSTRVMTASKDQTLKLWDPSATAPLKTMSDHRSAVTRVRFAGGGPRNASASAGGSIRIWDDLSQNKTTEIRMDFMHVSVYVTVIDHNDGDAETTGFMGLIVYLALYANFASNGLESNHNLRLSFGRLDDLTKTALENNGVDLTVVEKGIREQLDRDLPLGIAQGKRVQQIRMQKFFDGADHGTLGIYVDLALRSGPGSDEFLPPRGTLALAQNFREPAKAIAFATSPGLFGLLGPDAKFQRAELAPGSSEYHYPFREDMSDSSSKELGTINSFSIGPTSLPPDRVHISMDATYTDLAVNVGFTAHFYFNPKRDPGGLVDWESDVDVDFGLLATLLIIVGGLLILAIPLAPVGVSFWLMVGTIASLVGKEVGEHVVSKDLAEKVDEESQAGVLDSLPFRLPAAFRRWDPFYETQHQIVARLDAPMVIDQLGVAFTAEELVLDKKPVLQADIAPYDEVRQNGEVVAIRYEVPDLVEVAGGLIAKGPGVDRMDFERSALTNEPTLVSLTLDQINERKAQERILAPIVLDAQRINMFGGQIERLLCATWLVRTRERDRLIGEFQSAARTDIETNDRAAIEQDATTALTAELGRAPTQEEVEDEVELRVQSRIVDLQRDYEDGDLRNDLHDALAPLLHFDLAPEELIALQGRGIFSLDGKEIIVRENRNGSHTPYYRDHPDGDPRDNLLSLPHYQYPYVP